MKYCGPACHARASKCTVLMFRWIPAERDGHSSVWMLRCRPQPSPKPDSSGKTAALGPPRKPLLRSDAGSLRRKDCAAAAAAGYAATIGGWDDSEPSTVFASVQIHSQQTCSKHFPSDQQVPCAYKEHRAVW